MRKIERLMNFSHYTQYNQSFMIKSLGANEDEKAKYIEYLDSRRESRETRKKSLVEFVLKERNKGKKADHEIELSSPQNEKQSKDSQRVKG